MVNTAFRPLLVLAPCFILMSSFASRTLPAWDDEVEQQAIRRTFERQVEAWNRGDLEQFMETYWKSPKLTFSAGGRTTRGWDGALARYKKSYPTREQMGTLRFSELEVTLLGDSSALALGRWKLIRKADQPEGNFSVVLRKLDGQWRIIHDHSSSLDPEEDQP